MGRTEKGFDLIPRSPQLGKIKTCYISYGTEFVEQKNKGKKKRGNPHPPKRGRASYRGKRSECELGWMGVLLSAPSEADQIGERGGRQQGGRRRSWHDVRCGSGWTMGQSDQKQLGRPMTRDFAGRINLAKQGHLAQIVILSQTVHREWICLDSLILPPYQF